MKFLVLLLLVGVASAFPQQQQYVEVPSTNNAYLPHVEGGGEVRNELLHHPHPTQEIVNLAPPPVQEAQQISHPDIFAQAASHQEDSYANFASSLGHNPGQSSSSSSYGVDSPNSGALNVGHNTYEYQGEIVPGEFSNLDSYASFHNYNSNN